MPSSDTLNLDEAVLELLDEERLSFEELECESADAEISSERIALEAALESGYGSSGHKRRL